ncbi:hypothetical protein F511_15022 [Dorcoceras hygrometricum]|uniref:PHD and RING finger domain-containing protein 1-like n=1 Tax=Dorcoceras hygrometricum TaxID=472368 RepID=A0A2Z7D0K9_9LAMI|nr:hypothetical protein F511_15022 [Dorcoceras hygrometricum]
MARRREIAYRCRTRKKVWVKKQGSDESDEDYIVGEEDGLDESEDERHSFVEDESEESLGEFEEEEEDAKRRKEKAAYCEEENQDDDNFNGAKRRKKSGLSQDVEEGGDNIELRHGRQEKPRNKTRVLSSGKYKDYIDKRQKRSKVSYREEKGDYDFDDSDSNINEEFAPDDVNELLVKNRNKVGRLNRKAAPQIAKGRKRKRNSEVVKMTVRRKPRTQRVISRRDRPEPGKEFRDLRVLKEEVALSQRKLPGEKGKEKLEDMTIEVGKQVCGICLSEEGKRTVRGILNCCSHYFCLSCIMEWSKVESRCPLCKQRFATITRNARIDGILDLRDVSIPVPEQDQVYQPSEEELRSYLDPYENVLCTECQQGGDDALMLLCDLCDSPAHTYCVGLGYEVPEGNWYCDVCNPTILVSSNPKAVNSTSDHGAYYNLTVVSSPGATVPKTFDLNESYVPDTPLTQLGGPSSSPRHSLGDSQAGFPSGSLAFTVSARQRRRIQLQMHQVFDYRSRHSVRSEVVAQVSGSSLFGTQIGEGVIMAPQQTVIPARIEQQNVYHQGRLPTHSYPFLYSREALSPRLSSSRGQIFDNEASASRAHSLNALPCNDHIGINLMIGRGLCNQQFLPCSSRSDGGPGTTSLSSRQSREMSHSPREKERVQTMVKGHLKSLSRNIEIGYRAFKDIARVSTHTLLAAVGQEHLQNQVCPVHTRPLSCDHFESPPTYPIRGQCCSCFDWFVSNVVREIVFTRV